ncbi:type III-A CRISPR-associated CARF protein Csm6 [Staphylococcus chromogenes]|uniref:type III-A CRISPR-associated CARF protein Csm6 n=1 Tax=Staphylococcus chromogenes TaxID=46126 RepID=UPI0028852FD5|nr:type III-A CRISPR-associated CARF protein Csm6 [Staphylococcus chromogenes]MDT0740579.1 type III-A CRISPR-associated CARF protein Csm6 [Staphylococcus chromogenes]
MFVLFSPVGNSDPWRSGRDGAMLHIVRHFKPQKVTLFFTESLWEGNESRSGHKNFDWENIVKNVSPQTEVDILVEKIENAQDFDIYKDIFHKHIKSLEKEYPESEILLNVTSGTPQMEATLCLEFVTYPERKRCIQVSTPEQGSNANLSYADPKNDLSFIETINHNENNHQPRFKEVGIISFREAMIRSQLLGFIDNYDYEGALALIKQQSTFRNKKALVKLLTNITQNIKTHTVFPKIQNKYTDDNLKKVLFHYLILNLRFQRGDVAEVLIRVKSIAEYIAEYYLHNKYPDVVKYKGDRFVLNENNEAFKAKYMMYLKGLNKGDIKFESDLGLPAYVDITNVLEKGSKFNQSLNHVININGYRNSIAHRLEPVKLKDKSSHMKIENAVNAIKESIELVFKEVDKNDFKFLDYLNETVRDYI